MQPDAPGLFDLSDLTPDPVQHYEPLITGQHIVIIRRAVDDAGIVSMNELQELIKTCTVRLSLTCASSRCRKFASCSKASKSGRTTALQYRLLGGLKRYLGHRAPLNAGSEYRSPMKTQVLAREGRLRRSVRSVTRLTSPLPKPSWGRSRMHHPPGIP